MLWMNYNSLYHSSPDLRVSTPVKKKPTSSNASVLKGLLFHCRCSSPRRQNTTVWYFKVWDILCTVTNVGISCRIGSYVVKPVQKVFSYFLWPFSTKEQWFLWDSLWWHPRPLPAHATVVPYPPFTHYFGGPPSLHTWFTWPTPLHMTLSLPLHINLVAHPTSLHRWL